MNIDCTSINYINLERTLGIPPGGPKAVPLPTMDFSANTQYNLDLSTMTQRTFIDMIQTVWVDNSQNPNEFRITCPASQQTLRCPASTQGYYTILCPNPAKLQFTNAANNGTVSVILINCPVWP